MAFTLNDLATSVLRELMKLDATEAASTEDLAAVQSFAPAVAADLVARRIVSALDVEAIAVGIFPDLVKIVAERIAPVFGRLGDTAVISAAEARLVSNDRLDRDASIPLVRKVLQQLEIWGLGQPAIDSQAVSDEIPTILSELAIRDVIYISDPSGVPDQAMPALVRYIAASLGRPIGFDVMLKAEMDLRRMSHQPQRSTTLRVSYF